MERSSFEVQSTRTRDFERGRSPAQAPPQPCLPALSFERVEPTSSDHYNQSTGMLSCPFLGHCQESGKPAGFPDLLSEIVQLNYK